LLYALFYEMAPDGYERISENLVQHRVRVHEFHDRGVLLAAGALGSPPEGALSIMTSREAAEEFAAADPFVTGGVVESWRVVQWPALFLDS
jgi:uncharacterized protein